MSGELRIGKKLHYSKRMKVFGLADKIAEYEKIRPFIYVNFQRKTDIEESAFWRLVD